MVLWLGLLAVGCGSRQQPSSLSAEGLELGLYEVTERVCENPLGVPEDCPRIQYVELVKGTFYTVAPEQTAFVVWLASARSAPSYTYGARRLRGRLAGREYVIDETPKQKEWLVLERGAVRSYRFVMYRSEEHKDLLVRMHLTLKATIRTPEIDRRMPYPTAE